ncbi:hypothetical protein [Kibdelosporangium philippinense]|uniref:hypothetical protein n=1 Tax=Kibdelosporangium philippinense TaxID=211113 RepID=UPI0036078ED1
MVGACGRSCGHCQVFQGAKAELGAFNAAKVAFAAFHPVLGVAGVTRVTDGTILGP